jgi:hypothetical protein
MKLRIPASIDLSVLEFLDYGDKALIAHELTEERTDGKKVNRQYVSNVLKGRHRNDKILTKAFELAIKRKGQFPQQALKALPKV